MFVPSISLLSLFLALASTPISNAQDLPSNITSLTGTWTTGSGAVVTGPVSILFLTYLAERSGVGDGIRRLYSESSVLKEEREEDAGAEGLGWGNTKGG